MSNQRWTEENIREQKNSVVIVTGGNSGLGFEAARALAGKGATIILAARNTDIGKAAAQQIMEQNKTAKVDVMKLDLADLQSAKVFCSEFIEKYNRLNVLINNAGVMVPPYSKTKDGFELQFGVNHLGHFALTGQLLKTLMNTENSRVVTVSSLANDWKGANIYFEDLHWEKKYDKQLAYSQSKLANLLFAYELDRRFKETGCSVLSLAAHPGWSVTNLQNHMNVVMKKIAHYMSQPAAMGVLPALRAAADPNLKGGEYFGPSGRRQMKGYPVEVKSNGLSHDRALAKKLWKVSEELTGVSYEFKHVPQRSVSI